ncbi:hypothetical protein [uncultured Massilia sp.]|uniref:hypothetical protein n=1 Tax=uncultured Massilia sp. TaxID=169973 RepID=UPI0025D94A0F|nr:hypothetical protein [uncultured Massilia sp.]
MDISNTFDRLYGRFYFGGLRNAGTLRQFLFPLTLTLVACAAIGLAVCVSATFSNFMYRTFFNRPWIGLTAKGALGLVFLWFYVRFAPYKCTNMMLRPDGEGRWSIHMGPAVSMNPLHYAFTRKNMIDEGESIILSAALRHGLTGVVTLESHLYGTTEMRRRKIEALRDRFPELTYVERGGNETVNKFDAYWLSVLRWCLLTRVNLQRRWNGNRNLIDKSRGRITSATRVGAIEIRIGPPGPGHAAEAVHSRKQDPASIPSERA